MKGFVVPSTAPTVILLTTVTAIVFFIFISLTACSNGSDGDRGPRGLTGAAGAQGAQGEQGVAGANGQGCSVSIVDQGVLISCPDSSSALVEKVKPFQYICHVPAGNPSNGRNFYAPDEAVAAHLAHGDYLGECN